LQEQVVEALLKPAAYDEEVDHVEMIQTHVSFVFLAKNFAYKVKKAVDLGFLDFTTLEKRRFYCQEEIDLNLRLCKGMYLEVVPINKSKAKHALRIKGDGATVEYAVKMKRMPQERMMNRLLEEEKVGEPLVERIARITSDFHARAATSDEISAYGSVKAVRFNWDENFQQTQQFVGRIISQVEYENIQSRIRNFLNRRASLFEQRLKNRRIRDCHGDIHSGNIFVADRIYIFDAIEFNQRFRYSDVASDVAFLAMDLDFKGHPELSQFFTTKYSEYSGDEDVGRLLPFYKCYRAYVRGKVTSFRLEDPNTKQTEFGSILEEARAYFKLACFYSEKL
jgi:aminoglycoside phosphotransferase family enzyme